MRPLQQSTPKMTVMASTRVMALGIDENLEAQKKTSDLLSHIPKMVKQDFATSSIGSKACHLCTEPSFPT